MPIPDSVSYALGYSTGYNTVTSSDESTVRETAKDATPHCLAVSRGYSMIAHQNQRLLGA